MSRESTNQKAGRKHELAREHLGLDWYDTESQARRVIEAIAAEEAGLKLAEAQIVKLREQVANLEKLRPHWAQGFTSDGVAAQTKTTALAQLWELLGVEDQTAAMAKLRSMVAPEEPVPVEAVAATREDDDGQIYLDWLLEGGVAALEIPGILLFVSDSPLTNDEGHGTVYPCKDDSDV